MTGPRARYAPLPAGLPVVLAGEQVQQRAATAGVPASAVLLLRRPPPAERLRGAQPPVLGLTHLCCSLL